MNPPSSESLRGVLTPRMPLRHTERPLGGSIRAYWGDCAGIGFYRLTEAFESFRDGNPFQYKHHRGTITHRMPLRSTERPLEGVIRAYWGDCAGMRFYRLTEAYRAFYAIITIRLKYHRGAITPRIPLRHTERPLEGVITGGTHKYPEKSF